MISVFRPSAEAKQLTANPTHSKLPSNNNNNYNLEAEAAIKSLVRSLFAKSNFKSRGLDWRTGLEDWTGGLDWTGRLDCRTGGLEDWGTRGLENWRTLGLDWFLTNDRSRGITSSWRNT